jgi:pyridinium-3,5-biscarboxylic acid mononucleotide sulfurtransferase
MINHYLYNFKASWDRGTPTAANPMPRSSFVPFVVSWDSRLIHQLTPANMVFMSAEGAGIEAKRDLLRAHLRQLGRTLVAYSGGVDSAYLAWAAHQVLGDHMLAIIADSPSLARTQLADAVAFAGEQAIPLEVIATSELDRPEYVRNDAQRCFFCKDELFTLMENLRVARGFDAIAYGVNLDDQGDFRPGQKAAGAHRVLAPLLDAGLTKQEIRALARSAGLRIWDKPASACLSSRIEYGRPVTREALEVVEKGEDALRALGFRQFRVRHHGEVVRIEIAREELERALDPAMAAEFTSIFKGLGFKFVTLDLEGFRSGSMNALLSANDLLRRTG